MCCGKYFFQRFVNKNNYQFGSDRGEVFAELEQALSTELLMPFPHTLDGDFVRVVNDTLPTAGINHIAGDDMGEATSGEELSRAVETGVVVQALVITKPHNHRFVLGGLKILKKLIII